MTPSSEHAIRVSVITGIFALLGTLAGTLVKGYLDIKLEEQKFRSSLIMRALEGNEVAERRDSLKFLVETNLIDDENVKNGLRKYYDGANSQVPPRVLPVGDVSSKTTFSPRTSANANKTDIDLFLCQDDSQSPSALAEQAKVAEQLKASGQFGEIIGKIWGQALYKELDLNKLKGNRIIIYDENHEEQGEVKSINEILGGVIGSNRITEIANTGTLTPWRISVVLCP